MYSYTYSAKLYNEWKKSPDPRRFVVMITFHFKDKLDNRLTVPDIEPLWCCTEDVKTAAELFAFINTHRPGWYMHTGYGLLLPVDVYEVCLFSDTSKIMLRNDPVVLNTFVRDVEREDIDIWRGSEIDTWVREKKVKRYVNVEVTLFREKVDKVHGAPDPKADSWIMKA